MNARISNGEFSERGLARLLAISQPQLHNVLKGARKLQPELADRLMLKFDIGVLDLLYATELAKPENLTVMLTSVERHGDCSPAPQIGG